MLNIIYIEEEISNHPRVREICARFPEAVRIPCKRYGEIFNRKAQNFRLQKRRPALILAKKYGNFILDAPAGYGIGAKRNFYFSHMLNCAYDCRYCFLQGMYRSASYVLFINYEDFQAAIEAKIAEAPDEATCFFSGYDCDSLAFDSVTHFVREFLPFFTRCSRNLPGCSAGFPPNKSADQPQAEYLRYRAEESAYNAWFELRTKSAQINPLLKFTPAPNCVIAFSFTPQKIASALEHQTPSIEQRLKAMAQLAERGWKLGLRFDPLIDHEGFRESYGELFKEVFGQIPAASLHSVTLGPFRLPKVIYENMLRLYPDEKLFAGALEERKGIVSYAREREEELTQLMTQELLNDVPQEILFPFTFDYFAASAAVPASISSFRPVIGQKGLKPPFQAP